MHRPKIAITGTTGFIGSVLANCLPYPQKRLVRQESLGKYHDLFPHPHAQTELFIGSLHDHAKMTQFVSNTNTLVHLACNNHPRSQTAKMASEWSDHFLPTARLFETFASHCPNGHVIFVSTGGNMYADDTPYNPHTEEDVASPRSFYALEKLTAEHTLRLFCSQYGLSATVLRVSNPYGMILSATRLHGLIGIALSCLFNRETLNIFEPWETVRDYLHIEDLKSAFQRVFEHPPKPGEFRLFNVSSGIGHSIKQVITMLERITGGSINTKLQLLDNDATSSWSVLSNKKIKETLNWSPTISFEEGLITTYEQARLLQEVKK